MAEKKIINLHVHVLTKHRCMHKHISYYNTGASVCLFVCPDDYARVRSAWRFRFDTGAAWGGGEVEFA